jgi:hypothetical protein
MAAADLDPCARLCVCGVRGCNLAEQHAKAFVSPARARQGTRPRHRRGRRT